MSLTIVRDAGAYGFDTTPIAGTGLSAAEIAPLRTQLEQARLLADALGLAIAQARAQGAAGFRPADLGALLPVGLAGDDSSAEGQLREQLFSQRLGLAYGSARPATLAEWSRALDALQHWIGATASRLPPGLGGGTSCVQGSWYVNGEPYSLAELFTANRVNTFAEIDTQLAAALNVIAANNEATKALTGLMKLMFERYETNAWSSPPFEYRIGDQWVDAVGQFTQDPDLLTKNRTQNAYQRADSPYGATGWTIMVINNYGVNSGTGGSVYPASEPLDHPISYATLLQYAEKYIGPDSLIRKLQSNPGLMKEDFRAMIDEVEKIIAAKAQDNQVAQLRNQTLMDSRASLLDGLSGFLKGQQGTRSAVSRNL